MRFGLDYGGLLPAASHHAIGSSFACRYLRELGGQEVRDLHAAGIDLVLIYERNANRALGGYRQGVADGAEGLAQAHALGAPATSAIYYAIDFDETPAQAPAVAQYLKGIAAVLPIHRVGAYGGFWTISRLFDAGMIHFGWQTYAWSGGQLDHRCQLFQYSNNHTVARVSVDYDHALAADFGQWGKPVPAPKPAPAPHPTPKPAPEARWASVEVSFPAQLQESTGHWRAGPVKLTPQEFNAPPLGG